MSPSGGGAAAVGAAAVLCASSPAFSQHPPSVHATAGLGAAVLEGEFGLEAVAGGELRVGSLSVVARPAELAVLPGESDPRYRWETLARGQRRCREVATGRFARNTRCIDLEAEFGASVEAGWRVAGGGRPLLLGAGVRAGAGAGPYGTVRWRPVPAPGVASWHLQAAAGPRLFRFSAGAALRL